MQVPIKRAIERVPGGMMVVPLFTDALFTGSSTVLVPLLTAWLARRAPASPVDEATRP